MCVCMRDKHLLVASDSGVRLRISKYIFIYPFHLKEERSKECNKTIITFGKSFFGNQELIM